MYKNNADRARFNMVHQQIQTWNVFDDRVLDVLSDVPREDFLPEAYRSMAYFDVEIPMEAERPIPAPKIEAKMLQALAVQPGDNILEVGTGSGFVTACLAKMGGHVTSTVSSAERAESLNEQLDGFGIGNVSFAVANMLDEVPHGPYDAIVVNGSLHEHDEGLQKRLKIGGRLFVVVGEGPAMEACLITRVESNEWQCDSLFETELPPFEEAAPTETFSF